MFAELMPLLAGRVVCIMASRIDDQTMRVIVLPKPAKEGENGALSTPLCFSGTPEDLDANFSHELATYAQCHKSLGSTLAEAVAAMEAAAKAVRDEARRKAKSKVSAEPEKPASTGPAATTPPPAVASTMDLFDHVSIPEDSAASG
jgi:PRTRC genetic system protein E